MEQDSNSQTGFGLPQDAVERVTLEARKEGVFAGKTPDRFSLSCLQKAVIGGRLFGFKRNATLFCGVLSGVLSGYFFTQAFKDTAMAQLRAEEARLRLQAAKHSSEIQPDSENFSI
ncbi:hypothetical protein M413DRAFT_32945 [Hebeloma cylindrosporum]|uniref:Uncharacterized protein n=1 Tax=Hebeloma cylindrosporum TaxID=76867 RepID=A0A0C3BS42_HEBCY|nr:hypothetical protein M413DRAFT_32945 [Hebeloma cylindrosporum h7]